MRRRSARPVTDESRPALPATMIFGRPVLPPDVGAFQLGGTAGGRGSADSVASGVQPAGSHARPVASVPTTSDESASSTMAASSAGGSFADTGCGIAPSFHAATTAM